MVDPTGVQKRPVKQKKQQDAGQKNQVKDIPNSRMYAESRELDLRIEQHTNRKKAEIFDLDQHHQLQTRTLRLHLYNQHFNQNGVDPNAIPSWSFFIYGQFLDQDHALRSLAFQTHDADKKVASRFWTTAMSSIEIKTIHPNSPEEHVDVYRWHKNRHVGQHKEGIEIHRTGKSPVNIEVKMIRDFAPELLLVSEPLASALEVKSGTRGFLLHKLWNYTKSHSTPDDSDPAFVHADKDLTDLLGESRLMLGTLGGKMDKFLSHPKPVELTYSVMLDGPSPCTPLCFDIEVAWSLRQEMLVLPQWLDILDVKAQLTEHDRRIADVRDVNKLSRFNCCTESLQAFRASHKRHKALIGFAANPVDYIHKFIASSALEVRGSAHSGTQEATAVAISGSENFALPWAHEAAVHLLTRPDGT